MNNLGTYLLACRMAGLPPDSPDLDPAQVSDALNGVLVVRVVYVCQLTMEAKIGDMPESPDRQFVEGLAREYAFTRPSTITFADLFAAIKRAPFGRFCKDNGLDPTSRKARRLFVAQAILLENTDLRKSPAAMTWLRRKGITTLGELGAKDDRWWETEGASGRKHRGTVQGFLSENRWTSEAEEPEEHTTASGRHPRRPVNA